jgi:hypothetical protein
VKTIGGVVLAAIGAVVVAFIVDIVLAFRIAAHDSNMTVPTANHIVQITFLIVFAIGIFMLILVSTRKGDSRSSRTSNSAARRTNNRTSNWAAPTNRTGGIVTACSCGGGRVTCPSCGGRGWHIGNSGKYDQSCVTCGTSGKVTCGRCRGTGKTS